MQITYNWHSNKMYGRHHLKVKSEVETHCFMVCGVSDLDPGCKLAFDRLSAFNNLQ